MLIFFLVEQSVFWILSYTKIIYETFAMTLIFVVKFICWEIFQWG